MLITIDGIRSENDRGMMTQIQQLEYYEQEKWFINRYCSCGTTVGHIMHNLDISVSKKIDREKGYEGYGWANASFVGALVYCASTVNQENRKFINKVQLSVGRWVEFFTPGVLIYAKTDCDNLVKLNMASYFPEAKNCPTYTYTQNGFLGEYAIKPGHSPQPKFIIVGRTKYRTSPEELHLFRTQSLNKLNTMFPNSTILHMPNANLIKNKQDGQLNSTLTSKIGYKIIQYLKRSLPA